MLIDTHCHIHESSYPLSIEEVVTRASEAGVHKMICVGTNEQSSRDALRLAHAKPAVYAAIGVHPHDTIRGWGAIETLASDDIVAIGEIGLDYFYAHSPRSVQITALESQLQTAMSHNLPVIFHVREAFDDFWPIFDNFPRIRGVLHSFTDTQINRDAALTRGLSIGVNGISVFTKDRTQQALFASIPLASLLLETDSSAVSW
jgi:TatD DNase family protein